MNRIIYFSFMLLVFGVLSGFGQIVIDSNEYNTTLGTKHYLYSKYDTTYTGFSVDVGSPGANQTWSYTLEQFPRGEQATYTVVDPAATPAGTDFPEAHHAWFTEEDTVALYQYFKLTSSELSVLGMAFVEDSISLIKYEPPEKLLAFPATYNTSWQTYSADRSGTPGEFEWIDSTSSSSIIDAWGTITVPSGTYSCLRVKEMRTEFNFMYIYGTLMSADTTETISYSWFTENTGFLASITSLDGETDPNFTLASDITLRTNGDVAIGDDNSASIHTFVLKQNYPNPFNPETTIQYDLAQQAYVELAVYDQLGKKLAVLFTGRQNAGSYAYRWNADGFASGVYFYQLKINGGQQQTRKLILLR